MPIECIIINPSEYPVWDTFVSQQSQGTLFHTSEWLGFFNDKSEIVVAYEGEKIVGGMPIAEIRKAGIKGYHILPFSLYYGVVFSDDILSDTDKMHEVSHALIGHLPPSPVHDFLLPAGHQPVHPWTWNGFDISVYVTHVISSATSAETYLSTISAGKRRDLATAKKLLGKGEIILRTGPEILPDLIDHVMESSRSLGYKNSEDVFRKIVTYSKIKCFGVYHSQHGLLSGNILFEDENTVFNLFNATKRIKDPKLGIVNVLNMSESVLYALKQGKHFDFEGSMLKGVEKFYRAMGGTVTPVYRVTRSGSLLYNLFRAIKKIKAGRKK